METLFKAFELIVNTEGTFAIIFRLLLLKKLARWGLARRGAVTVSGFKFFPHRAELTKDHGTLGARLNGLKSADVIWVIGARFYNDRINIHVVKRVILTNPKSKSLGFYGASLGKSTIGDEIKETTRRAQKAGAKVRWCDEFVGQSIVLADTDEETGWVHIETVLPYTGSEARPSYTVYKSRYSDLVKDFRKAFDDLWDGSSEPEDL